MTTLTIGLPFYNNAATLADAIRSVYSQTYQDWELILMDDGSTDGSLDIARSVSDPRVIVVSDGANKGLVYRLNQIAQLASGRYLARMDADDLMLSRRLENQVRFLLENPDCDVVDCALYSMDQLCRPEGIRGMQSSEMSPQSALKRALLMHATVVGRTDWFRQHPYDPLYVRAEDYELWCRTCTVSKFGRILEPLYVVREGRVNVRNYLLSSRTCRLIMKTYGPRFVGWCSTARFIVLSHLKSVTYWFFSSFGIHDILVRRRNKPLSAVERDTVAQHIKDITSTHVPGLDDQDTRAIPTTRERQIHLG